MIKAGVAKTPRKFPMAAFRRAQASSPPEDVVSTITMLTVVGRQAMMTRPSAKSLVKISVCIKSLEQPKITRGTKPKLKSYKNM